MSVTFGGFVSGAVLMHNFEDEWFGNHQNAIKEASMKGEEWLLDETQGPNNTPIDTGDLISTVQIPIENQHSVTFRISGVLTDPHSGRPGRPYGFAQEFGWHDRAGAFHEGHHMVQTAVEVAAETYVAYMQHTNIGLASKIARRVDTVSVAGVGANPGLPY
jgi:hypothetical protein